MRAILQLAKRERHLPMDLLKDLLQKDRLNIPCRSGQNPSELNRKIVRSDEGILPKFMRMGIVST